MLYADYNGSAPLHPEVISYMQNRLSHGPFANPNAIHSLGKKVLFALEKCRMTCAKVLGAETHQISFNSGSSEGISQVFFSELDHRTDGKNIIITSGIEHSAVVNACKHYEQKGYRVLKINTLQNGQIDLNHFYKLADENKEKIALVTVMAANNETGVIQPWQEVASFCNENKIIFFSDTTQYIGKTDFNFATSKMDYAVLSGHKVGALIGSGLVLSKDPTRLKGLIFGGGQEKGTRGGTQNYLGAESLAVALDAFKREKEKLNEVAHMREQFEKNVLAAYPSAVVVGSESPRLASTTLIALPGLHGQAVQIELESNDIFVTTSSACSDNEPATSKVLKAMGIDDRIGRSVVRISFCTNVTAEDYQKIEKALIHAYQKLEKIHSY
jgi:cysteine desulfurase